MTTGQSEPQLIILPSLEETGHPVVLTQTWILLTQIKPSLSTTRSADRCPRNRYKCSRPPRHFISFFFYRDKSEGKKVWTHEETMLNGNNNTRHGGETLHFTENGGVYYQQPSRRMLQQRTDCIFKHHPELSPWEFADNWHTETTMNNPCLPILHIFTLSLMLFVLTLIPGRTGSGDWQPTKCLACQLIKVWLQLSAPSLVASNEALHKYTHLHQRSTG